MPDQGDPIRGLEERFAAAVELGQPSGHPVEAELARDLEIAAMLRAMGPALSPAADAKARARARVMAALAAPADPVAADGGLTVAPRLTAPDNTPTERLPVVAPAEDAPADLAEAGRSGGASVAAAGGGEPAGPTTAVLAGPDLANALRPRRRRRHALPSRPSARAGLRAPSIRSRIMVVGAAALLTVIAVAGGGIFVSRDAVPGDALYGIKRAAEAAGGIFTSGDASRGQRDLDLAVTRLDEIERMVRSGAPDADLLQAAFQDFTAATSAGSRLVLTGADADHSAADLASWSTQQTTRLSGLRGALPASAQQEADDALNLLDRVHRRSVAIAARASCAQATSGTVDDIGPMPATGPCAAGRPASTSGSAPSATDPAARSATGSSNPQQAGTATSEQQQQQDSGSDQGLVPGAGVSTAGEGGSSAAPTTTQAPPSGKNVDVPLPLPVPITVPPLVPGKPGISLG